MRKLTKEQLSCLLSAVAVGYSCAYESPCFACMFEEVTGEEIALIHNNGAVPAHNLSIYASLDLTVSDALLFLEANGYCR